MQKAYHYQNYHHYCHLHHHHHHLHHWHNIPPTLCRSACQIFLMVFRLGVWKKFWIYLLQTVVLESRFIQIQITPLLSTLGCRNKMIQEQEVCLELLKPACLLRYINFKVSFKSNWKLVLYTLTINVKRICCIKRHDTHPPKRSQNKEMKADRDCFAVELNLLELISTKKNNVVAQHYR